MLTTCCTTTPVLTFSVFDDSTATCCGESTLQRCQCDGTTCCSTTHVLTFSVVVAFPSDSLLCWVFLRRFVLYVSTLSGVMLLDVLCSVKVLGGLIVGGVTLLLCYSLWHTSPCGCR